MRLKPTFIQKLFNFCINILAMHRLRTVVFFVTNKCNAACKTCFYWNSLNRNIKELTLDEISKIASHLKGFEVLQISGGEPFLRKDLSKICKIFIEANHVESIHIPTNCLLPDEIFSETENILQLSPKIKVVMCLSLDGIGPKHDMIRGVKGNFDKFLKTVELLKLLKQKYDNLGLQVLTTLNEYNSADHEEISNFVTGNLGLPHKIDIVRKDTAREKSIENVSKLFLAGSSERARSSLSALSFGGRLRDNIRHEQAKTFDFFYRKSRTKTMSALKCSAGKNVVVIEPDGGIRFCEKLAVIGNLRDHDYKIREVIRTPAAQDMRRKIDREHCVCDNSLFLTSSLLYSRYYTMKDTIIGAINTILMPCRK